jgi:hypothetical protein
VISSVHSLPAITWPAGWEDAEVVDSVLVHEPGPLRTGPGAGAYDRFGRVPDAERYGALVSVVA